MTAAELIERYVQARVRLTSGHEPPPKPRRFLLPPGEKPKPIQIPKAVLRKPKVPKVIHARVREVEDLLPLPDAETWKRIVGEVCEKHGIDWLDLASVRRHKGLPEARFEAMYRMRYETTMSLPAIGRKLGGRHHTTVLHGIRKHAEGLAKAGVQ